MGCIWTFIGFVIGAIGLWLCLEAWRVDKVALLYLGPVIVLCVMFCYARVMDAIGAAEAKVYAVTGTQMTVTLHMGDCLEYMRTMPAGSVDAVITDPPYGNETKYNSYDDTTENLMALSNELMEQSFRIAQTTIIISGVTNQWFYPRPDWVLAWITEGNTNRSPWGFQCWQPILCYGKDPFLANGLGCRPDIIKVSYWYNGHNIDHPCPKPEAFMRLVISRCTSNSDTIFDPLMGSGTTGVACVQLGRSFIGCEIDPGYFAIAEKRIKQAQLQYPMELPEPRQEKATQLEM